MRQDKEFKNTIIPLADKLFRLALSITGNKQDAEDVVQDALLKVWQKRNEWDRISNLEGYCFRSVRNIALDKIALKDNQWEELPDQLSIHTQGPDKLFESKEQLETIQKIMALLPEKLRTVFQLRDLEGFSYKEIMQIMDIPEDQVKISLFRARQKIRENIESV